MGGKRELELEICECLSYCLYVKLMTQKTSFFRTAETLLFSYIDIITHQGNFL